MGLLYATTTAVITEKINNGWIITLLKNIFSLFLSKIRIFKARLEQPINENTTINHAECLKLTSNPTIRKNRRNNSSENPQNVRNPHNVRVV